MKDIFIEKARKIKCLICDVDGVLTDCMIYLDNAGNELKSFNIQDGMGLKLMQAADIEVAIITTSRNSIIDHRMKQLAIKHYFTGQYNKQSAYEKIKETLSLTDDEIAYIGDDLPDLFIMRQVGLGIAVANARPEVKAAAFWQTEAMGGNGGVREACDRIIEAQGKQDRALERYMNQCLN